MVAVLAGSGCQSPEQQAEHLDASVFGQILEHYVWQNGVLPASTKELDRFQEENGLTLPNGGVAAYTWVVKKTDKEKGTFDVEVGRIGADAGQPMTIAIHPEQVWRFKPLVDYQSDTNVFPYFYSGNLFDAEWNHAHWVAAVVANAVADKRVHAGMSSNEILNACEEEEADLFDAGKEGTQTKVREYSEGLEVSLEPNGDDLEIVVLGDKNEYRYQCTAKGEQASTDVKVTAL